MTAKLVYIVDDEPELASVFADAAEIAGCETAIFGNPDDFLDAIEERQPDMVIIDIVIPGMDGIELIEQLEQRNCTAKVFFISGYSELYLRTAELLAQTHNLDVGGTVSKPARLDTLIDLFSGKGDFAVKPGFPRSVN